MRQLSRRKVLSSLSRLSAPPPLRAVVEQSHVSQEFLIIVADVEPIEDGVQHRCTCKVGVPHEAVDSFGQTTEGLVCHEPATQFGIAMRSRNRVVVNHDLPQSFVVQGGYRVVGAAAFAVASVALEQGSQFTLGLAPCG